MSRRNKMIWGLTGMLAVIALILGAALFRKQENMSRETAAETVREKGEENKEIETEKKREQGEEETAEPQNASVVFTGDVLLSNYVLNNYENQGIERILDTGLLEELKSADVTVINEEFPFSTRGVQAEDKQFTFRVDPSHVSILKEMGVDMAAVANNHILDYGEDALTDTLDTLEQAGILYAGAGADKERAMQLQVMEVNGIRIGMLAVSRVIPEISWNIENRQPGVLCTYDPALLLGAIDKAKESCDYLFVYVHWGIERNTTPEEYQKNLARQYIDAGADAVIGAHPHVLQGIEFYQGKPVFYSLGNFIFNQTIEKTMAVRFQVDEEKNVSIRLLPASASNAKTGLIDDSQTQAFYRELEEISYGIHIQEDGSVSGENQE